MIPQALTEWEWRCLHCRGPLAADLAGLRCAGCGRQYPVVAGVFVLVKEPAAYLRSELAVLVRTYHDACRRRDLLDRIGADIGLPDASIDRHRDVLGAEITQIETFLGLLEPAAQVLGDEAEESPSSSRSGWTLDALLPYLLRDWTSTTELEAVHARIDKALKHSFPDPRGRSLVFAACGAGGLLAEVSPDFDPVLGFDLTLPVLAAARHLLDGKSVDLALPRAINQAGRIILRQRGGRSANPRVNLAAMDAFDTAFADGSVDCVITSFLLDLFPEPPRLAAEINRILCKDGVWINYGPSGPLKALWRFDRTESVGFFEAAGFTVTEADAYRTTYLDLSRDCPSWSFQNHICYLTSARKSGQGRGKRIATIPSAAELPQIVPQHFPGADLIRRRSLGPERMSTTLLRHEAIPGRVKSIPIGSDTARIMTLVDGNRTVSEIAELLEQEQPRQSADDTVRALTRCFEQGLLSWRGR